MWEQFVALWQQSWQFRLAVIVVAMSILRRCS
jgi:hypothetical protein